MNPAEPNQITRQHIRRLLETQRPELYEEWEQSGTLDRHLERLTLNARWNWEQNRDSTTAAAQAARQTGRLVTLSIEQALWLATPEDLDEQNLQRPDPDRAPLSETQLRSGWFSI